MPQSSTFPHIVIVGAGISGLAAAKTLLPTSCHLTVLEARNRWGGRAYTDRSHGIPIDHGASWIHGFGDTNPLTAVAKRAKLRTYTSNQTMVFTRRAGACGGPVLKAYEGELYGKLFDMIAEARRYVNANRDAILVTESLQDYIEEYLKNLERRDPANWGPEKIADLRALTAYRQNEDAAENAKQTLKYLDAETLFEGDQCILADGYDQLIEEYAMDVVKSSSIKFGEVVKRIEYNETSVRIITTANKTYHADAVIVTLPLGVLKTTIDPHAGSSPLITFHPQLPKPKLHAIKSLGVGTLDKAIITFREDGICWPRDMDWIVTLPTERGGEAGRAMVYANGSENGGGETSISGHSNDHTHDPSDPLTPHLITFNRHMISYGSMLPLHPTTSTRPILVAYYSEQLARHIERIQPRTLLVPLFRAHLHQFLPTLPADAILSAEVTRWNTDPFSLGSYTHIPIGGASPADLDVWARPVGAVGGEAREVEEGSEEGVLYWAGEHTIRYFASMHGALLSGEREGRKIKSKFGLERTCETGRDERAWDKRHLRIDKTFTN
ncbi:amine oxidase [Jimgerdemannia flammicorona]|uniref:Amine oxidase n=1 Tax=Jimgerdemannia flammicorona TaxID=994334 RepID=A0A433QAQ0_9FUNG|nr:amine oxidase [Jimgerdemannia flammicorona]